MAKRSVAIRRMSILVAILVVLSGSVLTLHLYRQGQRQGRIEAALEAGLEAYEKQDWPTAVEQLSFYRTRVADNAEAHYKYARARLLVPADENRHIGQAMRALQQAYQADPTHPEAPYELLELYLKFDQNEDALALANHLLMANEQDTHALRSKAVVLRRTNQLSAALEAANAAIDADPNDYRAYLLAMDLQSTLGESPRELIDRITELREAHPDDPNFELIQAYAYRLANDQEQFLEWLRLAADHAPPDPEFAIALVEGFDFSDAYDESVDAMQRFAEQGSDESIESELALRLFENNRFEELIEQLGDVNTDAISPDIDMLAIKAISLKRLGRNEEYDAIVTWLGERQDDAFAQAWADVLEVVYSTEQRSAPALIEACWNAVNLVPGHPYFNALLGDAYAAVNEVELALEAWQIAAANRPSWAAPRLRQVRPLLDLGRNEEALFQANAARVRQGNRIDSVATWALALSANIKTRDDQNYTRLMGLVSDIQEQAKGEEQTLVLQVSLFGRSGRHEDAARVIREALAGDIEYSEVALLALAAESREQELGLEDECYQRSELLHGMTPNLALARAIQQLETGNPAAGVELIESARPEEDGDALTAWRVVRARYLDFAEDGRALEAWRSLADDFPDNPRIQQMALDADATDADRELTDRLIDRLRDLSGDLSLGWQVERAKWLIAGGDHSDCERAVVMLREVIKQAPLRVEARLLLATALQELGRLPLAVEELGAAVDERPDSPDLAIAYARLLQASNMYPAALEQARRVANMPAARHDQLRQAAALFISLGEQQQAIALLERLVSDERQTDREELLMLAKLYQQNQQPDKAEALIERLLAEPSEEAVLFVAGFHAQNGDGERASEVLDQLLNLNLPPGRREMLMANHTAVYRDMETALSYDREAIRTAPNDPEIRRNYVSHLLIDGRIDEALSAAEEALAEVPDEPSLRKLVEAKPVVHKLGDDPLYRALIVAIVLNPDERDSAAEALEVIAVQGEDSDPQKLATALRGLADQHTRLLPLQTLTARFYLNANMPEEAATIAGRANSYFSSAVEPAALAADAYSRLGRWQDALVAARQWRQRSPVDAMNADIKIAEAQFRLARNQEAINTLEPYIDQALADPEQNREVISIYTHALVITNRLAEARRIITPMLELGEGWRITAARMAVLAVRDPQGAGEWLDEIEQATPGDEVTSQFYIGESYFRLAELHDDDEMLHKAELVIERLVNHPDADASAWFLRGLLAEAENEPAAAIESYRRSIELNPQHLPAKNNLALVLAEQNTDINEAMALAQDVVDAMPQSPQFLDTLATVQLRAGRADEAVATIQTAIKIDTTNPAWKQALLRIYTEAGMEDEAATLRRQLIMQGIEVPQQTP